jgi:hypothetical protein
MAIGEWNERAHYAVTELIFFLLATIVLFLASAASVVYKYVHHRNKVTFFFCTAPSFGKYTSIGNRLHACYQW